MNIFSAHIELRDRDVSEQRCVALVDKLHDYHAAVGASPRGWLSFQISVPGESFSQATTTALAVAAAAVPGVEVIHADIMTEAEFDALNGFVPVPELVSVTEAAEMRGVSRQAILQMIDEGRLPSATKVGKTIVIARSDVEAKSYRADTGKTYDPKMK